MNSTDIRVKIVGNKNILIAQDNECFILSAIQWHSLVKAVARVAQEGTLCVSSDGNIMHLGGMSEAE